MKTIVRLTLIIITLIAFQSCTYECPGFPESETIWIPHENGDILKYFSDSDSINFEVIENFKTEPSEFKGFVMDYWCDYEGYYLTNINENGLRIKERITIDTSKPYTGMQVSFSEIDNFEFSLNRGDSETDDYNVKYFTDTIINSKDFNDVFLVKKKDLTEDCRIDWIIKASNEGVIQYHDRLTNEIWTKIID